MNWWDLQTSLYDCLADNFGRCRTFRDILLNDFVVPHHWFFKHHPTDKWLSDTDNDLDTIIDLRTKEISKEEKLMLKSTLQCWTPSALLECKKKTQVKIIHKNPILQLDFDNLEDYDIDELKAAIYDIPFVCFVGLSASGKGLFALLLIEEPEKLEAYAEHCFKYFEGYGLPVDTSKGRNYTDLRFISYDSKMLFRDDPVALKIKRFNAPKVVRRANVPIKIKCNSGLITWAIREVQNADVGQRFEIVRKVAYTMGGHGTGLEEIKQAIRECSQYAGLHDKYLTHAVEGFEAGKLKPIAA
jgi:hypothetical protein